MFELLNVELKIQALMFINGDLNSIEVVSLFPSARARMQLEPAMHLISDSDVRSASHSIQIPYQTSPFDRVGGSGGGWGADGGHLTRNNHLMNRIICTYSHAPFLFFPVHTHETFKVNGAMRSNR